MFHFICISFFITTVVKLVHNSRFTDDEHRSLQRSQYILLCSLQIGCVVYKMEFLMLHPTVSSKSISYLGKWCATYPGAHASKSRDILDTAFSLICQYIPCWSCLPDTPWLMPLFCTSIAHLPCFPDLHHLLGLCSCPWGPVLTHGRALPPLLMASRCT